MNYWMYLLILTVYSHNSSMKIGNLLDSITFVFWFEYIKTLSIYKNKCIVSERVASVFKK